VTRNPFASSVSVEWATPAATFAALAREFGPFDLDPAATAQNAKAPVFYIAADDGLAQPWKGRVWLNPPYGKTIPQWMVKAATEAAEGRAELVCCLVPARPDTRWWRDATAVASLVRFLPGRIRFGGADRAPFPSAVVVFGTLPGRHGTVAKRCPVCQEWWFPVRADALTCRSEACRKARWRSEVKGAKSDQEGDQ
jgi:site-specific DNA-methyltransferase (adenine-specific)